MNGTLMNLVQLLRLRGGPQNLPASWVLMILLLSAYLVQNLYRSTTGRFKRGGQKPYGH